MSTSQEKAQCVSWFIETKSDIQAQRNFRCKYGGKPPARPTIRAWHKKFMETGSVLQRKRAAGPHISEEEIESVRVAYTRSLESPFTALLRSYRSHAPLQYSQSLHRNLRLYAYKMQLLQALSQKVIRD